MVQTAWVDIWGERVGAVAWDDATGYATFEYDSRFKTKKWELAPLQMPVSGNKSNFSFPALRKKVDSELDIFKGLPGLLADSLPDKYGNDLINMWLAKQGRPQNSMNPVEMLRFIGSRGMGALEFAPGMIKQHQHTFSVEIDSLVDLARKMLGKRESFVTNLNQDEEKAMMDILRIGTSAGGARPKAVIAYNEKNGEVKSGQTKVPKGFEHWLIKLDGVSDIQLGTTKGYGRVEMAYYKMAIACGVDMMPSKLLEENGRAHFMTKRFDREGSNTRHHIQTFYAMKHFDFNMVNSFSYEQLFQTMRELKLPYPAAEQMFRRMVFNVCARNCDDHTKNFAFRLKKDGAWELAPAYDVCHAYKPNHQWVSQHALSINGKRDKITKEDLLTIGESIKNKKAKTTIEEISETVSRWKEFANEVGVFAQLRDEIDKTLIHFK
ncbi:type II toxin-antitoxin system HipA family toxin [uncultured Sunxiuqinia sp.]|uniref:type II toxin-antitoxin system HipA family toxin n=1 Tax=uncultured Sunxiuqinia sp. TaxID=1573825 RepID=UPI0030D9CF3A|tara:strand:- start:493 stop:1800 length:1308 start_codon:yes stop_codon:yes gene_type:complete